MADKPVNKELNRCNMLEACEILKDLEYCVFYGAALGLYREGDIIDGDDDIDLLVDNKLYNEVDVLLRQNGFQYSSVNPTPGVFAQYYKIRDNVPTLLDIYFYENTDKEYVIEKWNISATPNVNKTHVFISKDIIFPIKEQEYFGKTIKVPNNLEKMCEYIYGERFRESLRKKIDYMQIIFKNKFNILYRT